LGARGRKGVKRYGGARALGAGGARAWVVENAGLVGGWSVAKAPATDRGVGPHEACPAC
jgi:hypothetical protein